MSGILVPKPMLGRQLRKGHRLAQGLVGHWLFNEGSGNIVSDLSGNGRTGTLIGDPQWVAGKSGSAIEFDGTGDYVKIIHTTNFEPVTLLAWFKADNVSPGIAFVIFGTGTTDTGADGDTYFNLSINSSSQITALKRDGTGNIQSSANGSVLTAGTWYFAAAVFESNTLRKIYLNGILRGTNTTNIADGSTTMDILTVGTLFMKNAIVDSWSLDGIVDHVMVYNRALIAREIAELYLRPFAMFDREPLPLWTAATQGVAPPVGMAGAMTTNTGYWGW